MKVRNADLEAMISSNSYKKLFTTEFDDILIVLAIRRQNEDLQPALRAYMDTKKALIEKYCDKNPDTQKPIMTPNGGYKFTQNPDSMSNFQSAFNELLDVVVDSNATKVKISTSALNAVSKWSGADINIVYPFIDIYEDDKLQKRK